MTSYKTLAVLKIKLDHYRNYEHLEFSLDSAPVIITGENGVGKTNIIESISLLSPGKGIRGVNNQDINNNSSLKPWSSDIIIDGVYGKSNIQMQASDPDSLNSKQDKRIVYIDGSKIRSKNEISQIFSVIWLTPQMDNIFISSSSERRKFFDRLVYNFDIEHATRISKYEYYVKERNKILSYPNRDLSWLEIVEKKISEYGVSVAASRIEAAQHLNMAIQESFSPFPKAEIEISGELEQMLPNMPALTLESFFRDKLKSNRELDANTARTNFGPHKSDIILTHLPKNQKAPLCSTGEQKALLISLILADVKTRIKCSNTVPVVLLDEVVAHLDDERKHFLFSELLNLKCQFFITGVDHTTFSEIHNKTQILQVCNNNIHRLS